MAHERTTEVTTPRTLAVATGELLRSRPATKMPGYVALEVVRPGKPNELWHVVPDGHEEPFVHEWSVKHGIDVHPTLYWNERGSITCEKHAPLRGSDTWKWEGWSEVPKAVVKDQVLLCEICPNPDEDHDSDVCGQCGDIYSLRAQHECSS